MCFLQILNLIPQQFLILWAGRPAQSNLQSLYLVGTFYASFVETTVSRLPSVKAKDCLPYMSRVVMVDGQSKFSLYLLHEQAAMQQTLQGLNRCGLATTKKLGDFLSLIQVPAFKPFLMQETQQLLQHKRVDLLELQSDSTKCIDSYWTLRIKKTCNICPRAF